MKRFPVLLLCLGVAPASADWSIETSLGAAYNVGTRLTIEQEGAERLSVDARYQTRSFESPLYYMVRVARWTDERAWELSLIHDKLFLRNPPPGVGSLSISHGFNLITVNRAIRRESYTVRLGGGVIVTHPEAEVRGVTYDGPYDLAGLVALAGVSKRVYLDHRWFLSGDAAISVGYAHTEAGGSPGLTLTVPHAAVHAMLGIGRDF